MSISKDQIVAQSKNAYNQWNYKNFTGFSILYYLEGGEMGYEYVKKVIFTKNEAKNNYNLPSQSYHLIMGVFEIKPNLEALDLVKDELEVCIIGGGEIYKQALPYANRIDLTRVHTTIEGGDAFFPEFSEKEWELVSEERHEADEEHKYPFTFLLYHRITHGVRGQASGRHKIS